MTINKHFTGLLTVGALFITGLAMAQSSFTFLNSASPLSLAGFDEKGGTQMMSAECGSVDWDTYHKGIHYKTCTISLPSDITVTYLKVTAHYTDSSAQISLSANAGFAGSTVHCTDIGAPYYPYGPPKSTLKCSVKA